MLIALGVYAVVALLVLLWAISAALREPTAHGQSILLPLAFLLAALWPGALIYLIVILIVEGARWVRSCFG
ncbi:hypothetical protein [Sphingomonas cavernae]|uniref:Uncharacterized protein n=1 Tax=Sphingomonas cavernae TaxID=2320861 RepID=A0A418WP13_9SPHN|nr:hypothetical protein [Sphingomonas cavernae]RJF92976.1 hypothetical protein D3876_00885 [Sphingomonas cavernae]